MTPDEMQAEIDRLRGQFMLAHESAAYSSEQNGTLQAENDRLRAAIERVRALHKQYEEGECGHCLMDEDGHFEPHPCPTLRALDGDA
jgi:hypothetical protein